ncbi:hypothetical protein CEXT_756011 [Caerostris extrusa]|uniref:Uncharacterized protein n=1 Tax=Caerostris extrusa TaxID=172846 RepID=A0AAV4R5J2_CAEEX|nr:hypothetical protein CEXT_756011 [Caerostris extrusa]
MAISGVGWQRCEAVWNLFIAERRNNDVSGDLHSTRVSRVAVFRGLHEKIRCLRLAQKKNFSKSNAPPSRFSKIFQSFEGLSAPSKLQTGASSVISE